MRSGVIVSAWEGIVVFCWPDSLLLQTYLSSLAPGRGLNVALEDHFVPPLQYRSLGGSWAHPSGPDNIRPPDGKGGATFGFGA